MKRKGEMKKKGKDDKNKAILLCRNNKIELEITGISLVKFELNRVFKES